MHHLEGKERIILLILPTLIICRNTTQEITIENPLDEQITFQTISSNKNNFIVNTDQDTITVQPKSQAKVNITFNPSSIGNGDEQQHQSKISFVNDKVRRKSTSKLIYFITHNNRLKQIRILF